MDIFVVIVAVALGAFLYRARGAGWNAWPFERPINQALVAIGPMVAAMVILHASDFNSLAGLAILSAIGVATTVAAGMGHGDYMRLNRQRGFHPVQDDEEIGYVLRLFTANGKLFNSRWAYEFMGLSLTGLVVTLPIAVLAFSTGHAVAGILFLIAGLAKGPAYELGWILYYRDTPRWMPVATEFGEWCFGAFLWGGVAFAVLVAV